MPPGVGRRALAGAVAVVVMTVGVWLRPQTPHLATPGSGDTDLIAAVQRQTTTGDRLAVLLVDDDGLRSAYWGGAEETTAYEIGSVSKALTGLVIADAVQRSELELSQPLLAFLPELDQTATGALPLRDVVTHRSGLPRLPVSIGAVLGSLESILMASDPYDTGRDELLRRAATIAPEDDSYEYSNVGAAVAGQAAAAQAGLPYPQLMRERLFEPVGMPHTSVQVDEPLLRGGYDAAGRRHEPWTLRGYAPAGGVVSTPADMGTLVTAILDSRAPGMSALTPLADTDAEGRQIGVFWIVERERATGQSQITWHNGATGGYQAFLGLDRRVGRGVVVLSNVSAGATDLGMALLTDDALKEK